MKQLESRSYYEREGGTAAVRHLAPCDTDAIKQLAAAKRTKHMDIIVNPWTILFGTWNLVVGTFKPSNKK